MLLKLATYPQYGALALPTSVIAARRLRASVIIGSSVQDSDNWKDSLSFPLSG
jgi:hypothetical protein